MASTINAKNTSTGVVITPDASGQLELQTADTTRMTITSGGDVGIGGTPFAKLDVYGADATIGAQFRTSSSITSGAQININATYSSTNPIYGFFYNGNTGIGHPAVNTINFITNSGEKMRIDSSGNVGIGTTSIGYKLDVATSSSTQVALQYTGVGRYLLGCDSGFNLIFSKEGTGERMRINSSGIVTMPFQPAFLATGSASNTTYTASSVIVFGTLNSTFVSSNRSSGYNTSTSTYTAPVAGLYQFYAQFYTSSNPTSIAWWKNGSQMSWNDAALVTFNTTGVNNLVNGSAIIELAAGDTINVRVRTGNANVIIYGGHSAFWGYLIG